MHQIHRHGLVVLPEFVKIGGRGEVEGRHRTVYEEDEVDALRDGVVKRIVQVRSVAVESRHVGQEDFPAVHMVLCQQFAAGGGDGCDDGAVFLVVGRRYNVVDGIVGIVQIFILFKVLLQFVLGDDTAQFVHDEVEVFGFPSFGPRLIDFNLAVFCIGHVGDDGGPHRAFQFVGRTHIPMGQQVDKRRLSRLDGSYHQHDERTVLVFQRPAAQLSELSLDVLVGQQGSEFRCQHP